MSWLRLGTLHSISCPLGMLCSLGRKWERFCCVSLKWRRAIGIEIHYAAVFVPRLP